MNYQQRVNINIDELHLHGLSGISTDRLHANIEQELAHMIHNEGLPLNIKHHSELSSISTQNLPPNVMSLAPADMARHIAQHIYQSWST